MRLIDADDFGNRMYHEVFEKDSKDQRWDSGCWMRYKLFERVLREQPEAQPDLSSYSDKLWRAAYERGKAEAQPQRMRGRWVEVTDGTCIWKVCDQCGEKPLWNEWKTDRCESNFCPNCGAKMENGGGAK